MKKEYYWFKPGKDSEWVIAEFIKKDKEFPNGRFIFMGKSIGVSVIDYNQNDAEKYGWLIEPNPITHDE
jgi:hypothetical protein